MVKGLPAKWGTRFRTAAFDDSPHSLAHWEGIIAVGLNAGGIIILDGTTGRQTAILSDHTDQVESLTFSSDGTLLVSGSYDNTIKLWDMQTGGVVNTFHGHADHVRSVSISLDSTTIASGSWDKTLRLWDVQTGSCCYIIEQQGSVNHVTFSPTSSQYLISVSGGKVQQWDLDGHKIIHSHDGSCAAFSSDGTQLILCQEACVMVQDSNSGVTWAKFHIPNLIANDCCFSPDGRLVAVVVGDSNAYVHYTTVYVWDVTGSDPHLVETLPGSTYPITSLVFSSPSSLITSSWDKLINFWQIGVVSADPDVGHPKPTPPTSAPINSITLHTKDGIFVSSDLDGMVRTWDISTGLCKTSLQTPAKSNNQSDVRLVDGRLILVWHASEKIHIWDVEKDELLQEINTAWSKVHDIRISGDGSKVFCIFEQFIRAWSIWTGDLLGSGELKFFRNKMSLIVDNSSGVWVYFTAKVEHPGWDFGAPNSPLQLHSTSSLHLSETKQWDVGLSRIRDMRTGKVILQLGGRSTDPIDMQFDGSYLLAQYEAGEALILDFNHVVLQ